MDYQTFKNEITKIYKAASLILEKSKNKEEIKKIIKRNTKAIPEDLKKITSLKIDNLLTIGLLNNRLTKSEKEVKEFFEKNQLDIDKFIQNLENDFTRKQNLDEKGVLELELDVSKNAQNKSGVEGEFRVRRTKGEVKDGKVKHGKQKKKITGEKNSTDDLLIGWTNKWLDEYMQLTSRDSQVPFAYYNFGYRQGISGDGGHGRVYPRNIKTNIKIGEEEYHDDKMGGKGRKEKVVVEENFFKGIENEGIILRDVLIQHKRDFTKKLFKAFLGKIKNLSMLDSEYPLACFYIGGDLKKKSTGSNEPKAWSRVLMCVFATTLNNAIARDPELNKLEVVAREGFGSVIPSISDVGDGFRLDPGLLSEEHLPSVLEALRITENVYREMLKKDEKALSNFLECYKKPDSLEAVDNLMQNLSFEYQNLKDPGKIDANALVKAILGKFEKNNGKDLFSKREDARLNNTMRISNISPVIHSKVTHNPDKMEEEYNYGYGSGSEHEVEVQKGVEEQDSIPGTKLFISKKAFVSGMGAINITQEAAQRYIKGDVVTLADKAYFEMPLSLKNVIAQRKENNLTKNAQIILHSNPAANPKNTTLEDSLKEVIGNEKPDKFDSNIKNWLETQGIKKKDINSLVTSIKDKVAVNIVDVTNIESRKIAEEINKFAKKKKEDNQVLVLVESGSKHPTGGNLVYGVIRVVGNEKAVKDFNNVLEVEKEVKSTKLQYNEQMRRLAMQDLMMVPSNRHILAELNNINGITNKTEKQYKDNDIDLKGKKSKYPSGKSFKDDEFSKEGNSYSNLRYDEHASDNAFNQYNNQQYQYQGTDIAAIIEQFKKEQKDESIIFADVLGRGSSELNAETLLTKAKNKLKENNQKIVGVYNTGGNHWIAFAVTKQGDKYTVNYKDSYGDKRNDLKNDFKKVFGENATFKSYKSKEQNDTVNCGIFALKNMEVFAKTENLDNLQVKNFYNSENHENEYHAEIQNAREVLAGEYAKNIYDETKSDLEQRLRLQNFLDSHQAEADLLKSELQKQGLDLPYVTVEVVSNSESNYEYVYQIRHKLPIKDREKKYDESVKNITDAVTKVTDAKLQEKDNREYTIKPHNVTVIFNIKPEDILSKKNTFELNTKLSELINKKHDIESNLELNEKELKKEFIQALNIEKPIASEKLIKAINENIKIDLKGKKSKYPSGKSFKGINDKEQGLTVADLKYNLKNIGTKVDFIDLTDRDILTQDFTKCKERISILGIRNKEGEEHAVSMLNIPNEKGGRDIVIIDPLGSDSPFRGKLEEIKTKLVKDQNTNVNVIYSNLQDKSSAICADTSLILAKKMSDLKPDHYPGTPDKYKEACLNEIEVLRSDMYPRKQPKLSVTTAIIEKISNGKDSSPIGETLKNKNNKSSFVEKYVPKTVTDEQKNSFVDRYAPKGKTSDAKKQYFVEEYALKPTEKRGCCKEGR